VRLRELRQREMFVPLQHPPGDAQADFGEALAVIVRAGEKLDQEAPRERRSLAE